MPSTTTTSTTTTSTTTTVAVRDTQIAAEVLDRSTAPPIWTTQIAVETLEAKIYDDLAGHDWAGYTNGNMTISVDSIFGLYSGWRTCERTITTPWGYWLSLGTSGWWKIDFGASYLVELNNVDLVVNDVPEPNRAPKNFTVQGSNNDSDWDTLYTSGDETGWGSGESRNFIMSAGGQYRYIKIDITANNGDGGYTQIAELYLWGVKYSSTSTTTTTTTHTTTTHTTTTTHEWEEDFSSMATGDPPPGWTETWDTAPATTVEAVGKDKSLTVDISVSGKIAITNNAINKSEIEILALVQAKDGFATLAGGIGGRISGGPGTETGYVLFLDCANDRILLRRYNNGTSADLANHTHTINADGWYWLRLRISGSVIKARVWDKHGAEPGTWDIDHTDGSPVTAAGEAGVCTFNADVYCDHFLAEGFSDNWPITQPDYATSTSTTTTTTTTTMTSTSSTSTTVTYELIRINGEFSDLTVHDIGNWQSSAYKWVDGSIALAAEAGFLGEPRWYQQELVKAYTIKKIRIYSTGASTRDIRDFDVLGSNTGAFGGEEDTLLQVVNQTGWSNEWREWDIENTTAYKYIRIAEIYGINNFWMHFYEMELLAPYTEVESFGADLTGSATMSAGTGTPADCVDDNLGTYWATATTSDWLQAYWAAGKIIRKVTMQPAVNKSRIPHNWTLKASDTGAFGGEEDTLLTVAGSEYDSDEEKRTWVLANTTSYKYYRFDPMTTNGTFYIYLAEMEMMEGTVGGTTTTTTTHTTTTTSTTTTSTTTTTEAGATYWTNFSEYTPDQAPDDWTEVWENPIASVIVKDDGGQYGGQYLQIDHTTYGHYFVEWDDVGVAKDVDVLSKIQFTADNPLAGKDYFKIILRQTGGQSDKNGYEIRFFPHDDEITLWKWVNDINHRIGPAVDKTFTTYWYWVRFQVRGNDIKVKVWAGNPVDEPGTWDIETTDTAHSGIYGSVGLGSYEGKVKDPVNSATRVDYFAVGVGGSDAPAPANWLTTTTTTTTTTSTTTTGTTESPMEPATYIATGTLQTSGG